MGFWILKPFRIRIPCRINTKRRKMQNFWNFNKIVLISILLFWIELILLVFHTGDDGCDGCDGCDPPLNCHLLGKCALRSRTLFLSSSSSCIRNNFFFLITICKDDDELHDYSFPTEINASAQTTSWSFNPH